MPMQNDVHINKVKEFIQSDELFKQLSEFAEDKNVELFIVGGFVRDLILERKRTEVDFLVLGNGPEFAKYCADKLNVKKISIFKTYGTAHFRYKGIDLEFVGARKESYDRDSRNPDVEIGTFEEDIARRDFTINTLAASLSKESFGDVIDKYDGIKDLENKIIRTPIDPLKTFDDDPLRILRAFRFATQLNFEVHPNIMHAAGVLKERMKILTQERITDEFLKIMAADKPSIGLKLLFYSEIMEVIFPEISNLSGVEQRKDHHHKDVFLHTCIVIDNIAPNTDDVWLRMAALFHDIAKPKTKRFVDGIGWTFHGHEELGARMMKYIFKKMKFPFHKLNYVEKLVRLHLRPMALVGQTVTDSAIRRLIVNAGEDLDDLITLCRADITSKNPNKVNKYLDNYERVMLKVKDVREKDKLREFQSPVSGEIIMKECNLKPSKTVGLIKSAIEEAILEGNIANDYDEAYQYMLSIKDDYLNN